MIEQSLHFVSVDNDGHFFTDLSQIHNCLTVDDNEFDYKKLAILAIANSIKKGYKMIHKDDQLFEWDLTKLNKQKPITIVPYQLCPKCFGTGKVMNNENWGNYGTISSAPVICDVCNGAKIIPQAIL